MNTEFFTFKAVEEVKSPCATCFWGGASLVAAAVVAGVTIAAT